jgi:dienelactone hydrolase
MWIVASLVIGGAIGTIVVTLVRSTVKPSKSLALFIIGIGMSLGTLHAFPAAAASAIDETLPPGNNYDKAEFRLWIPEGNGVLRAAVILVPGSNGDGRPQAEDAEWQAFATGHRLALIGCRFTDKPHDQNFIEEYVNVSHGSGQALETALRSLGERSRHPELASIPLLLWGMSAGGEFNYEFVAWKPDRVAAFVVNKGGIYYSALLPQAARNVPGMLFVGGKDLESRINTITGLFAVNRRAGALWALAEEPSAAHIVGRSMELAKLFFEDIMSARVSTSPMKTMSEKEGFIGDPREKAFHPAGTAPLPNYSTAWLPTARVARAWQAMITEKPFEP